MTEGMNGRGGCYWPGAFSCAVGIVDQRMSKVPTTPLGLSAPEPTARKRMHPLVIVAIVVAAGIGLIMILGIVAAIALPALLRSRMAGNEASAIGSLRAISSAQVTYSSSCGAGSYAPSLEALGRPSATSPGLMFLSPELGLPEPVEKSGYTLRLTATPDENTAASCNGVPAGKGARAWAVVAAPIEPGVTGSRYFATDTTGNVYQSQSPIELSAEKTPLPPAEVLR
jgi:type IV pilus assembly protein PilA